MTRFKIPGATRSYVLLAALALAGCGGASSSAASAVDAVNRLRTSPAARSAEKAAPREIALADIELKKAHEAADAGDSVSADLYAARAQTLVERAIVLTRYARAAEAEQGAKARAEKAAAESRELAASRSKLDAENTELDKKIKIARELGVPPQSGPADPKREAARKVAAESLLAQARLLCGAARLVTKEAPAELADAEKALGAPVPTTAGAAIDAAARARASCLGALTKARRQGSLSAPHADALLSELSASGRFDAARDERGVVVTLRDVFDGESVKSDGEKSLGDLGRVLKANPAYKVQVVVHEAAKRADGSARAKNAAQALAQAASVAPTQIAAEDAGSRLPTVDPGDAKLRGRNARLEVVFVSPGNSAPRSTI